MYLPFALVELLTILLNTRWGRERANNPTSVIVDPDNNPHTASMSREHTPIAHLECSHLCSAESCSVHPFAHDLDMSNARRSCPVGDSEQSPGLKPRSFGVTERKGSRNQMISLYKNDLRGAGEKSTMDCGPGGTEGKVQVVWWSMALEDGRAHETNHTGRRFVEKSHRKSL